MSAPAAAAAAPAPAKPAAAAPAPADAKAAAPAAAAAPAEKSARVFVGNLAFKTTSDALKAHMAQASPAIVSAEIISYASGRSKGCGLVEYKSVADAEKAVKTLTNTELEGRKIFVREDREPKGFGKKDPNAPKPAPKPAGENKSGPKPAAGGAGSVDSGRGRGVGRGRGRGGRGRGRGGRGGGVATDAPPRAQNTDPCNLYVGNLAWSVDDKELSDLFADFGEVKKCVVAVDRSGRSKGFATVHMAKPGDAQAAIAGLNDTQHKERKLVVRIDHYAA